VSTTRPAAYGWEGIAAKSLQSPSPGSLLERKEAETYVAARLASTVSAKLAPSDLFPFSLALVREKLRDSQTVVTVNHDHFSARDQFAIEKQIDRLLYLLIEFHDTARAKIKNVF